MTVFGLALLAVLAVFNASGEILLIDGDQEGRVYDGLGVVSSGAFSRLLIDYPEPQHHEIIDYLLPDLSPTHRARACQSFHSVACPLWFAACRPATHPSGSAGPTVRSDLMLTYTDRSYDMDLNEADGN